MEIWKASRLDNNYEVSSEGRIRSIERLVIVMGRWGPYKRRYGGKTLSPTINNQGYAQISGSSKRHRAVHRLVAYEFVEGYKPGLIVNHKNGNRADNNPKNLEWVTYSENCRHGFRALGRKAIYEGKFSADHPTSKPVISRCVKTGDERVYLSAMDAVREGFDSSSISRCANGQWNSHKGRHWRFLDPADPMLDQKYREAQQL